MGRVELRAPYGLAISPFATQMRTLSALVSKCRPEGRQSAAIQPAFKLIEYFAASMYVIFATDLLKTKAGRIEKSALG